MSMNGQGIRGLLGREVKVNRGPEAVQGKLIDVRGDYMAISCKNGLVYVNGLNIKSITDTGRSSGSSTPMMNSLPSKSFLEVLEALRLRRVQINLGCRDEVEGVLTEVNQNSLIIITVRQEIVQIPTCHVKSICIVRGGNKSSGNKSCGKPSHPDKSSGHKCCEKHPHKSTGHKCCEKHPHKSTGHKCCEKHPHKSTGHKCCEKHPHKSSGHKCCEKHPHKSSGHKCCEKHPHKSTGHKCCEKHPHKSTGYVSGRRK